MPKKPVSRPVANSLQSGTFKKGGKVGKFNDGGSSNDKYVVKDPKAVSDKASRELEDAMNPLSMAKELYGKAKNFISPSAGFGPRFLWRFLWLIQLRAKRLLMVSARLS